MTKLFNIISILVIICILLLPNFVQATDIDMNLSNTTNLDASNVVDSNTSDTTTTVPGSYSSSGSFVSSLNSLPEAELGLTNILSIILIVIGVLLILLAIAILIRLKH